MSGDVEELILPERRAVVARYQGPRKGLGGAMRLIGSWVGTYFADRVNDVTVCFGKRRKGTGRPDPDQPITAEIRFEVDASFSEQVRLPDGLTLEILPREHIISRTYEGPLSGFQMAIQPWIESIEETRALAPGFRQRMIERAKSPTAPGWELEVQLVVQE